MVTKQMLWYEQSFVDVLSYLTEITSKRLYQTSVHILGGPK